MKKILLISGTIAAALLVLILTGFAGADDSAKKAMRDGKKQFAAADYGGALLSYETGLAARPDDKDLNFGAAQSAYMAGDYMKAAEYYEKAGDNPEKYINLGNIYFKAGDYIEGEELTQEELEQKAGLYIGAAQTYMEGIEKYPRNIPLKYNYEAVMEKISEMLEEQEQEQESESEEGDGEEGEGEQSESSEGEGDESEQSEANENEEDESEQSEASEGDDDESEQSELNESGEDDEEEQDREAIERILQMLENQEEESLKNNQEMRNGSGDANGW